MNQYVVVRGALVVGLLLLGCGPEELPYNDNSQDSVAYARDVKVLISSAARQAKRATEPNDYLTPVLHELQRTDRPLGEFGSVYTDLRQRVEQLVADCEKSRNQAPKLASRLDELVKISQSLPGEMPAGN